MMLQNYITKYQFIILLFFLSSCHITKPVHDPPALKVPGTFDGRNDSTGIGFIPRKDFFNDSVLVRLIDTVLHNNFSLKRAVQRIEFARAGITLTKGRYLPSINGVASAGVDKYGDYTMNGIGNFDTNLSPNIRGTNREMPHPISDYFLGLKSGWELNLWGLYKNQKKAANARFLASQKGRHMVITALVAEVSSLYYNLLALDYELLTIRRNIELQQRALEVVQIMKEGARSNELAVKQFNGQLLNTKSLEALKQQQIVEVENQINILLGRFPQPITRGPGIHDQKFPSRLETGFPASMLVRRPDIQQAELELAASKADVNAARAAFFPSINISGYVGLNAFSPELLFNTPASIAYGMLSGLVTPLINRSLLRGAYAQASAGQLDAYYAYQQAVVSAFQEVNLNLNGIKNYGTVFSLKEKEVESLLQAVNVSNELFLGSYASYLEVITAQKTVLQAELESTDARKNQFLSLIGLYRALGGGWE